MAMDDYLGCVDVVDHPDFSVEPYVSVYPLMGVDNNSIGRVAAAQRLRCNTKGPCAGGRS